MIVKNVKSICTHCGLPVPAGLVEPEREEQFCCHGCSAAYHLIHASGLGSFYEMVDSDSDVVSLKKRLETSRGFEEFDETGFFEKFVKQVSPGIFRVTLSIEGIHCAACVWLIEKLPGIVPGVVSAQVNWARHTVAIVWQAESVPLSRIAKVLSQLGYAPRPSRTSDVSVGRLNENRRQLTQIGIAAAAAGNNMLIAGALYLGMFSYMTSDMRTMLRLASCLVGVASFLGPGRTFLKGAWAAIRTRTPHMDLPIALGLTAGIVAGTINTIRGQGDIYFDSLSILISVLLVGRWIQFRQQNRATDAIEMLYRLTPSRARKVVDGQVQEIDADELKTGDWFEVRPGDLVAADGVIVDGESQFDESLLTGESRPTTKSIDSAVLAGTTNLHSRVVAMVSATGAQTRISRIVDLVDKALNDRPLIVQWANRIGGRFVMVVLVLALFTFFAWLFIDAERAVDRAVALLIVACPCALAMATPIAISVALGRLACRKILVKAGDVLQHLSRPGIAWLDKTGTLTDGNLEVKSWLGASKWIPVVAQVESHFNHPLSQALVRFAEEEAKKLGPTRLPAMKTNEFNDFQSYSGGVGATFRRDRILLGNRKLMESKLVSITQEWLEKESEILDQKNAPCWIAVGDSVVAMVSVSDTIRRGASELVKEMKELGWEVGILSGDHPKIVERVATQLGIDKVVAGVTPEEKLKVIQNSESDFETIMMVGDGVNDSAALAAATVGIAVHNGAEASLAAAPVYLGQPGLSSIRELIGASRTTTRTTTINLAASLFYNAIGVTLAMVGVLDPLVAALLMPLSSLTVISLSTNAARSCEIARGAQQRPG